MAQLLVTGAILLAPKEDRGDNAGGLMTICYEQQSSIISSVRALHQPFIVGKPQATVGHQQQVVTT